MRDNMREKMRKDVWEDAHMNFDPKHPRYQPALAGILPAPLGAWFRNLPVETFMACIGALELAFGVTFLFSLVAGGRAALGTTLPDTANKLMCVFMIGPITAHLLGDDFSLGMDSEVGPGGVIPAAVVTVLLLLRLRLQKKIDTSAKKTR